MAVTYGYARCSTDETRQDIDRQKRELLAMGVSEDKYIYWEYESGVKTDRPELQKLMDIVREGDTICATEVSRLTRSTKHLCEILQTVQDKKLRILIGSFSVDCRSLIDPRTKPRSLMKFLPLTGTSTFRGMREKGGKMNCCITAFLKKIKKRKLMTDCMHRYTRKAPLPVLFLMPCSIV